MPYMEVWVDIDLSDEDDDELIEELRSRGYKVFKEGPVADSLQSVEHFLDCGLVDLARTEALMIVGKKLGRAL